MSPSERERRLILASRSPRRRELLQGLGFAPVVRVAEVAEAVRAGESPEEYTRRLSVTKAQAVAGLPGDDKKVEGSSHWVLAADTVVVLDGRVLEKPRDASEARRMLSQLSGRWHTVVTSFTACPRDGHGDCATRTVPADVRFRDLADGEIARYVDSGEPMDKAGAYGIQRLGGFLVREIRGSYFTVVGLPVCEVVETLLEVGAVSQFPFSAQGVG